MSKKKESTDTQHESMLISAAKATGTTVGKIAQLAGVAPEAHQPAQPQKVPKAD